jgi:hypothetical protein
MGIDKLKKKPNQLVSKRKDNKRPGYRGRTDADTMSGSGYGAGSSSSSSSSSDDNRENYISQQYTAPAPAPEPEYDTADFAFTTPSPSPQPDTSGDDQEDDVAQMMETLGITPDNAPTGFTPTTAEDDGDTGESLYTSPTQTMKDEEPYIDYKPGPNYVTAQQLSNLERGLGDADQRAATLANIQSINPMQQSTGILQTAGTKLKNIAIDYALNAFTGGLYGRLKTPYNIAQAVDNRLLGDRVPRITELAKNIPQGTGNRVPNTATGYESSGDDRPIPKNVIAANVQKFSPTAKQINSLQSNISLLESVLDSGQYRGTKLNSSQLLKISNQRNSLLEQYNMIQEYLV